MLSKIAIAATAVAGELFRYRYEFYDENRLVLLVYLSLFTESLCIVHFFLVEKEILSLN